MSKIKPISFDITYATFTEESVSQGDSDDSGFEYMHERFTFKELIHHLKQRFYVHASRGPLDLKNPNRHVWFTTDPIETDIKTGEQIEYAIHSNDDRSARYLFKAIKYLKDQKYYNF